MPYSLNDGVRTYYEVSGEGPAMLMVHANTTDHSLYLYQAARYSTWFKVITPDLRGWGRTRADSTPYGLEALCADMVAVCKTEGVSQAVVMGVSVGSKIGIHMALDHPDLVRALIAVGGSSKPSPRTADHARSYRKNGIAKSLPGHLASTVTKGFERSKLGEYLLGAVLERSRALGWTADGSARTMEAAGMGDVRSRLPGMKVPTLIVNGEFDHSRPGGEETASLIPGVRHAILKGAGHCCNIEDPAGFDRIALGFLADLDLIPRSSHAL